MRTRRPLETDGIAVAVVLLITRHVGKPCPTRYHDAAPSSLRSTAQRAPRVSRRQKPGEPSLRVCVHARSH